MELHGYNNLLEPELLFDTRKASSKDIHPLRGLKNYGPYSAGLFSIPTIRVAAIYPNGTYHLIKNLIAEFDKTYSPLERQKYLLDFTGFSQIFGSKLELANENVSIAFDGNKVLASQAPYLALSEELGNAIRSMSQRKQDFDVLMVLLPDAFNNALENRETGFDLHDFLKAITAMQSIPTQIVREESAIRYKCRCSVMWRLSIALYVKAGGVPYVLSSIDEDTAFIGLSYSTRYNEFTGKHDFLTCCSQVFDSDGTGIEFIAYDANEIESRVGDNPFLGRAEMRKVMSKSLNLYQRRHAGRLPKRLIVHKTTHFKPQEIDGAFDAIPNSVSLELLQIVQDVPWKGIKIEKDYNNNWKIPGFPLSRGSYLQIAPQEVLLWTQGQVNLGSSTFYKEQKGIPTPIAIRRFAGDGGWDKNCQALLGLTKMNWNHDGLYDRLPVTLGYSSVLARTIKRMNDLANKPYEFRYFM